MIVAVDQDHLAGLAEAEVLRHPPGTPQRRAAASLWVALHTTGTVDAARRALPTFTAPDTAEAALQLLGQLFTAVTSPTITEGATT